MSRDVVSLSYRQGGVTSSLFLQLMAAPAGRLLWFVTHLSSNAWNSTKTNRNSFKFQNSIDYIKMKSYTEYDIAFVIDEIIEGVSIRTAVKNWNILYNTLRNRIKGYQTYR